MTCDGNAGGGGREEDEDGEGFAGGGRGGVGGGGGGRLQEILPARDAVSALSCVTELTVVGSPLQSIF